MQGAKEYGIYAKGEKHPILTLGGAKKGGDSKEENHAPWLITSHLFQHTISFIFHQF